MTAFTTNTDPNKSRRLAVIGEDAKSSLRSFVSGLPALFARRAADPADELARGERREAARRAVDNLLLR